ncbi:MAG: RNA-binding protein [Candidatus Methanomethylicota archaeon]|uniref:RNA-binding protein n=1 Tax=Thermoproteota archaeon TaxID=2056631 RepID=A0A497ENG8_9CREN|nr:MAG: RNA-binding protein [Candidatus Verstraetearchaeota archaeon]RLE53049.1 MAG: RNA-binding protein [Candidatus Verstraetearchaeota archaeon]
MSETSLPVCISCKRPILPGEKGVELRCPNCGEVTFWRCYKCRQLVNPYVCPKCGFQGP